MSGPALTPNTGPRRCVKFAGRAQGNNEWLTPPDIIRALGPFDLDPCTPVDRPWDTATVHLTVRENGLVQPWAGRVWLNPPFGQEIPEWMRRMSSHGDGIALVLARTETAWFQDYVFNSPAVFAMLFLRGRLTFHHADGSPARGNCGGAPVLVAYGQGSANALLASGIQGFFVPLRGTGSVRIAQAGAAS
uniref:DNA N-6-adenine-methyltransferase (Dam) n=1 Tax=Desulfovibrio sp. U5L TaxID=596152 RepID=I2Q046_9BACT